MVERAAASRANKIIHRERGFSLPLTLEVEGLNTSGNFFKERTSLFYISYYGASFWLTNGLQIGSSVKLTVDLPRKLGEKGLKLVIKGKVVFLEVYTSHHSCQRVSVKFQSNYLIEKK